MHWGTAGESRTLQADDAPDWDGPGKMAGGAVGEGAALMAVGEAMGVAISDLDDEEAGGDCETVSHPSEVDVSGRAQVLSASDIWMKKTNCLNCNCYPCGNIQKECWPKITTKLTSNGSVMLVWGIICIRFLLNTALSSFIVFA